MFSAILSSTYVSMCVPASWRHGVDLEVPCCAAVQLPSVRSHQPRATHTTQCEYQEHRVENDLNITLSEFYTYSVLPYKMFLQNCLNLANAKMSNHNCKETSLNPVQDKTMKMPTMKCQSYDIMHNKSLNGSHHLNCELDKNKQTKYVGFIAF